MRSFDEGDNAVTRDLPDAPLSLGAQQNINEKVYLSVQLCPTYNQSFLPQEEV
jgi:hypothetical protein